MTIGTFTTRVERRGAAALGAPDWIGLAAAPTFAVLALIGGLSEGGASDALCATAHHAGSFDRMTVMYALMSVFHLAPWLRFAARWRKGG